MPATVIMPALEMAQETGKVIRWLLPPGARGAVAPLDVRPGPERGGHAFRDRADLLLDHRAHRLFKGAAGAVAWLALKESQPDGCTVANVVYPNIVLASMEDDEATFTADEFTHLGQTETAPQTIAVPLDSPFETIEDFLEAAEADPGGITVGGTGLNGQVFADQINAATGIEFTYVPMEGGVGDTIPLLVGGHVDAASFSSSHIEANSDVIRALVIAGDTRSESDNLVDVPTFGELGYEGVDMATTWGVLGPPGMPDDIAQLWNDAIHYATDSDEMRETLVEGGYTPLYVSLEEAAEFNLNVQRAFGIR